MHLIILNEIQFKNYAKIHSNRNYMQTIEYGNMQLENDCNIIYYGLIDDNNNLHAAALILEKKLKGKYKMGVVPGGYLINYTDYELVDTFTKELIKETKKLDYVYLTLNPKFKYKVFDKEDNILYYDTNTIDKLKSMGYIHLGFDDSFERFNVVLETNNNLTEVYNNFNRNTKRNIDKDNHMGISIHKGSINNIDLFYSLIRKKTTNDIEYYKRYFKYFNNHDNVVELYFSKINPIKYINNYRYLLDQEQKNNDELNDKLQDKNNKDIDNIINKKMISDKLVNNYSAEIVRATNVYKNFPKGLVVGTCAILKNNREIYFLVDGYEEKLRDIQTSYMLRWEIMKKYLNEGYHIFNLGEIAPNREEENNKYYGIYISKIGFNGNVIEYPGEFNLVVNNILYKLLYKNKKK